MLAGSDLRSCLDLVCCNKPHVFVQNLREQDQESWTHRPRLVFSVIKAIDDFPIKKTS